MSFIRTSRHLRFPAIAACSGHTLCPSFLLFYFFIAVTECNAMGSSPQLPSKQWEGDFVAALCKVHHALGRPNLCRPKGRIDATSATTILQALSSINYIPEMFFESGRPVSLSYQPSTEPPVVDPDASYILVRLDALTHLGVVTSVAFGGVVYEDPVLAVMAAWQVGRHTEPRVVPQALDFDTLWKMRAEIFDALPDPWATRDSPPNFAVGHVRLSTTAKLSTLVVRGSDLLQVRQKGSLAIFGDGRLQLFQLFTPLAKGRK